MTGTGCSIVNFETAFGEIMTAEKRGYLRAGEEINVKLKKLPSSPITQAQTIDIGERGLRFISEENLSGQAEIEISLDIPGEYEPELIPISARGKIVWKRENTHGKGFEYGIQFTEINDADLKLFAQYVFLKRYFPHSVPSLSSFAIDVDGMTKKFGAAAAVNEVTLKIRAGEIFGLLGPNGAGKTTLTRILTTLLKPTSGTGLILGFDLGKSYGEIRKQVGYMPQATALYYDLSARENLLFFGQAYGIKENLEERVDEVLAFVELASRSNHRVGTFSGGMKQRVSLACALMHHPGILFLDEPTAGVDLSLRETFWQYFYNLSRTGVTLFVTTHQMDEVQYCHRVAFMNSGKVLVCDTPKKIRELGTTWVAVETEAGEQLFELPDYRRELTPLLKTLENKGEQVLSVEVREETIEQVFRSLSRKEQN